MLVSTRTAYTSIFWNTFKKVYILVRNLRQPVERPAFEKQRSSNPETHSQLKFLFRTGLCSKRDSFLILGVAIFIAQFWKFGYVSKEVQPLADAWPTARLRKKEAFIQNRFYMREELSYEYGSPYDQKRILFEYNPVRKRNLSCEFVSGFELLCFAKACRR